MGYDRCNTVTLFPNSSSDRSNRRSCDRDQLQQGEKLLTKRFLIKKRRTRTMKSLQELTTVLFLVLMVGSFLCPSSAWIRWRRRRRRVPPVRRPQPPRTSGRPPYCPLDAKTKLITQRRFGRELHEFKRGVSLQQNRSSSIHGAYYSIQPLILYINYL